MKLTNPKNNEELDSPFQSHTEAIERLTTRINAKEWSRPEFPKDILAAVHSKRGASQSQVFWLHKLAMEGCVRKPAAPPKAIDLSGLKAMFAHASNHLKRPGILLSVAGAEIKLSLACRGTYAGQVIVASPEYGGAYYGRVENGQFYAGRSNTPEVEKMLERMAVDPEGTAQEYGRLTGNCCFCSRPLKDERSTAVGYGSTCAHNFGLSWGSKASAFRSRVRNEQPALPF